MPPVDVQLLANLSIADEKAERDKSETLQTEESFIKRERAGSKI